LGECLIIITHVINDVAIQLNIRELDAMNCPDIYIGELNLPA